MAKGISVLKFVGTVSLGLLTATKTTKKVRLPLPLLESPVRLHRIQPPPAQSNSFNSAELGGCGKAAGEKQSHFLWITRSFRCGVSYTVSAVTLPTLLQLPSSSSAAHALTSLQSSLRLPVLALSSLAAAPLFLSFVCSPRYARHPYLFYTSVLAVLSVVVPGYLPQPAATTSKSPSARKTTSSRARMEASYEVLGDSHSEGDLPSESELEDVNGEEVRANVEGTARAYLVKTGFAAAAFVLSVVGLWGDGAPRTVRYY
ncbi:hypothetical protein Trihar35433_10578 [Trichoderma harzianum]|nr:hypothetical protein Trihar35433_10578 [Trichoderma harzianum]